MLFDFFNSSEKRLIDWAKDYKINLPNKVQELSSVEHIDLSNRNLDYIPREISCLPNLVSINASINRLNGLTWEIGNLKKLRSLNLSCNRFSDVPSIICRLSKLEELSLSANSIKKLPTVIANLTGLKVLDLSFNLLPELCNEIGHLKHLVQLNVAANNLIELPPAFNKLYNLEEIAIWGNSMSERPYVLNELPNIKQVHTTSSQEQINKLLIMASSAGNTILMERAMAIGADINYIWEGFNEQQSTSALFEARTVDAIRLLISHGVQLNIDRQIVINGTVQPENFLSKKQPSEISKFLKSEGYIK